MMYWRRCRRMVAVGALALAVSSSRAEQVSIEGAPADTGYNVGSTAEIVAVLRGGGGEQDRYAVFAAIQYEGTMTTASVQLDRQESSLPGELRYEGGWPIPPDAPTGLYTVKLRVDDRQEHKAVADREVRGFAAYKKSLRITRVDLDRTFYMAGEPIRCAVILQNLTDRPINGL